MKFPAGLALAFAIGAAPAQAVPRLREAAIARAGAYSLKTGGQALVVLQSGRTIHESYANGGSAARPEWIMSITKNLAAVTALAAAKDRLLDLDEPVANTITEWKDSAIKRRITIRHLLSQTSGISPGSPELYARSVRNKNARAIDLPVVSAPGEAFDYGPANFEIFEELLRRKLARRDTEPLAYLCAKVLAPIDAAAADWRRDRAGNPYFSAGAKMTARDLAKFGEFVRARGRVWIIPAIPEAGFIEAAKGTRANAMYGLSFWLNQNVARAGAEPVSIEGTLGDDCPPAAWRRACLSSVAPPDVIAMVGSGGIRCYVVPSRKAVIVRFGAGRDFSDAEFLARLFGETP